MTEPRRFVMGLSLGLAVAAGLWLTLLVGQLGRPHVNNLWVEQAYEKKIQGAMQVAAVSKVLVVGGSGAMFGVNSSVLSEVWDRPVINLGVNAGIGPHFIIDYALPLVRAGDVIIAALEYPLYTYNGEINHVLLSFLLSHPGMLSELPLTALARTAWVAPLKRVLEGYAGVPAEYRVTGLYGPHNLDANGDQVNSQLAQRDQALHRAAVEGKPEEYGRDFSAHALGWQLWREFAETAASRGACVIFVPPPMMFRAVYAKYEQERRVYRDLPAVASASGLLYLGDPRQFLYPQEWFFDTNYHLVAEKRKVYTDAVISLIGSNPGKRCASTFSN